MKPIYKAMILVRAFEVWLLISVAETLHGVARIAILQPVVGDFPARQISVLTGSLIILGIAFLFRNWIPFKTKGDAAAVGGLWVGLTVVFEVALGRFALGLTWARILEDYDIARGGLMVFGLIVMFAAPFIALRYKRGNQAPKVVDGYPVA